METIDLKEIILNALEQQRNWLLENKIEDADDWVFSENDILDKALDSLGLTVDDIQDGYDFRDYQHETVRLCNEHD